MAVRQDKIQITIDFITDESKALAKAITNVESLKRLIVENQNAIKGYDKELKLTNLSEGRRLELLQLKLEAENKIKQALDDIVRSGKEIEKLDLSKVTPAQLVQRANQLAQAMRNIPQSAPQFRELEAELARVNGQLATLRTNAKGIQDAGPAESGGGFFGSIVGRATVAIAAVQAFFATVQGLYRFFSQAVTDFRTAAAQEAALVSRIESTEGAAGRTVEQLTEQARELQKVTFFTDDQTEKAQEILLTFTNVREEIFDRTIPAAQDLSTVFGQDLQSSAVQLGKALNDPVQGITALRRVGISFSDEQRSMIERLVETNQVAEAQALILEEVERQVGGAARAAAEAEGGGYRLLQQRFDEVKEGVGELISRGLDRLQPVFTTVLTVVEKVTESLLSGEAATGEYAGAANAVISVLQGMAQVATLVSSVFDVFFKVVLQPLGFFISNILLPAFVGLAGALAGLPRFISENRAAIAGLVVGLVTLNAQTILAAANSLRLAVASTAATVAANAQAVAQRLLNAVMTANPIGLVITALSALVAIFTTAYNSSEKFRGSMEGFGRAGLEIFKILIESAQAFARGFSQLLDGEFAEAGKSFAEGINKSNPIGIAFTQGERLGKAFSEGYNSGVQEGVDAAERERRDAEGRAEEAAARRGDAEAARRIEQEAARKREEEENARQAAAEAARKQREEEFQLTIKKIQIDQQRRELVLESFRIKEEISEERFQEGMSEVRENSLKRQLATYVAFGRAQENEALKIRNTLLEIEQGRSTRATAPLEALPTRQPGQVTSQTEQTVDLGPTVPTPDALRARFGELIDIELQYNILRGELQSAYYADQLLKLEEAGKKETDEYKRIAEQKKDADKGVAENKAQLAAFMAELEQAQGELFKESVDLAITLLAKDEAARKKNASAIKSFQTAQVVVSGISEVQKIWEKSAEFGILQSIIAGIQTAAAIIRTTTAVAKIQSTKFAMGTLLDVAGIRKAKQGIFGGKPHSAGGTKGYFEDGTTVEVEKDEAWAVINKKNTPLLRILSQINAYGGNGKAFLKEGGMLKFDTGGLSVPNTTPANVPVGLQQQQFVIPEIKMLDDAVRRFEQVVAQFPTEVKSRVVLTELEDASAELDSVREDAAV